MLKKVPHKLLLKEAKEQACYTLFMPCSSSKDPT